MHNQNYSMEMPFSIASVLIESSLVFTAVHDYMVKIQRRRYYCLSPYFNLSTFFSRNAIS